MIPHTKPTTIILTCIVIISLLSCGCVEQMSYSSAPATPTPAPHTMVDRHYEWAYDTHICVVDISLSEVDYFDAVTSDKNIIYQSQAFDQYDSSRLNDLMYLQLIPALRH